MCFFNEPLLFGAAGLDFYFLDFYFFGVFIFARLYFFAKRTDVDANSAYGGLDVRHFREFVGQFFDASLKMERVVPTAVMAVCIDAFDGLRRACVAAVEAGPAPIFYGAVNR